jgi:hypothetical protein
VPYFHVVFALPARIAAIAYQNKAVVYDLLFKASSEAVLMITADPEHLGARIGNHRRAPYLGLDHDLSPTFPHDRAARRHRLGWKAMAVVPAPLPADHFGFARYLVKESKCAVRLPLAELLNRLMMWHEREEGHLHFAIERPQPQPQRQRGLRIAL